MRRPRAIRTWSLGGRGVLLAASLLILAACSLGGRAGQATAPSASPTSSTEASPTPAATVIPTAVVVTPGETGWLVFRDPVGGFELQAPAWMRDISDLAREQNALVRVAVVNPMVQTTVAQVLVVPLAAGTTLPAFVDTTETRLGQIPGFRGISHRAATTLSGQPADRFDWSATSGSAELVEREYLAVRDGRGYVVSIDTTPNPRAADFDLFDKIVARFRFLP
jgi:hypothetical protein